MRLKKNEPFKVDTRDRKFEFIERSDQIESIRFFLKKQRSVTIDQRREKTVNPIMIIHGSPGSGKSRFIDEISQVLNDENSLIISITYNSNMTNDRELDNNHIDTSIVGQFYYRVLYS